MYVVFSIMNGSLMRNVLGSEPSTLCTKLPRVILYATIGLPPSSCGGSQVTLRAEEVTPVNVTSRGAVGASRGGPGGRSEIKKGADVK